MASRAAVERRPVVELGVVPVEAPAVAAMEVLKDPIAKIKTTPALPGLPEENATTTVIT